MQFVHMAATKVGRFFVVEDKGDTVVIQYENEGKREVTRTEWIEFAEMMYSVHVFGDWWQNG